MLDLLLLPDIHRLLQRELLGAQRFELAVVARVQVDREVLDVRDARADLVEEIAVVRDDQQDALVALQPALEPEDGGQVEMVRGLVEQQDVRAAHQCTREIQPHAPAAGKRIDRLGVLLCREAETVQQARRARLGREAVDGLHALVQHMQVRPVRIRLARRDGGLDLAQLAVAVHDVIDRGAATARAFLRHVGDFQAGVEDEFAGVRFQLAEQHREQRRLAAAVGPDHADTLPGMRLEAGVFDQDLGPASQADVGEGEHRRGIISGVGVKMAVLQVARTIGVGVKTILFGHVLRHRGKRTFLPAASWYVGHLAALPSSREFYSGALNGFLL